MSVRSIAKIVTSKQKTEGSGAIVHRSMGIYGQRKYNPFLLFDHFIGANNHGFPAHPHQGHETITYVLNGAVAHEDFTGAKGMLYKGDLQFMTAGKGIMHSEMPVSKDDESPTVGLQLWVDLPEDKRNIQPNYRDLREWEIPEVIADDGKVSVKVISGKSHGIESIKQLAYIPIDYFHYKIKPGGQFKQELRSDFNYFLYVIRGTTLELNDNTTAEQYQNVYFEETGDFVTGKNVSTKPDEEVEFAIIGGKKLDQDVYIFGTFAADTEENMKSGFQDFKNQRNGFEKIKTWKSLISKGVTQEMIDGPLNGNLELREKNKNEYLKTVETRENILV